MNFMGHSKSNHPIRGVLLDVDGTLVASNDAHAYAWVRALKEAGHQVTFNEIRPLIGMGGDKLLPKIAGIDADAQAGRAISKRRGMIFQQDYLPRLQPTNGAQHLLIRLQEMGIKMTVASSATQQELKPLLKICHADKYIEGTTSSDDAENSKPDPDILHAALQAMDLPPGEVVMIGDTPYDVEAARKAGMRVIGFNCGGWTAADLKADEVYLDPEELCDRFEQSMLANNLN